MLQYAIRRLLLAVPTLLGITLVTFLMIHLAPGDFAELNIEGMQKSRIPKEVIEEFRKTYHLDKPVLVQYGYWLKGAARLDFGNSFQDHRPVYDRIFERIPATLTLGILSLVLAVAAGIPLGVLQAVKHKSFFDKASGTVLYMLWSLPAFWVGIMLIILFSVKLQWLPSGGIMSVGQEASGWSGFVDRVRHLVLPVITLSLGSLAFEARFTRANLLEVIRQDYIRTAMAKGLAPRTVLFKHALRNAMIPILTFFGNVLPFLVSGSVIIEVIFSWPGAGLLFYHAMLGRDYPVIMGMTFLIAVLVLLSMLVTDCLYAVVDPRVRYK